MQQPQSITFLKTQDLSDVTLSESYCFICPVTPCHILDSLILQPHHSENLKSCPHFLQLFSPSLPAVLTIFDQSCLPSVFYTVQFCIYSKKTKFIGLIAVRSESCNVLTFYHGMKIPTSQLKIWQW